MNPFLEKQTDELLMAKVAEGNLDMLKVLFERHHTHIFNFLYKMSGDKMLSEDLTQDVFYKLMKYRSSYNNGNFLSWIFTITRNSLNTHFKRERQKHEDLGMVEHKLTEASTENEEEHSHLMRALAKLDTSDRELLVMNRLQEIKYQELAEIVGSTPGAVKTKVSRALNKLRVAYFEIA